MTRQRGQELNSNTCVNGSPRCSKRLPFTNLNPNSEKNGVAYVMNSLKYPIVSGGIPTYLLVVAITA
jgi:hypothetical protein